MKNLRNSLVNKYCTVIVTAMVAVMMNAADKPRLHYDNPLILYPSSCCLTAFYLTEKLRDRFSKYDAKDLGVSCPENLNEPFLEFESTRTLSAREVDQMVEEAMVGRTLGSEKEVREVILKGRILRPNTILPISLFQGKKDGDFLGENKNIKISDEKENSVSNYVNTCVKNFVSQVWFKGLHEKDYSIDYLWDNGIIDYNIKHGKNGWKIPSNQLIMNSENNK